MEKNRDCGENLRGSFAWFDPDSSSWKTYQRSLFQAEGWIEFSATWPKSGSMRSGRVFERRTLEPLTVGIAGFSLGGWPTPTASDSTAILNSLKPKLNGLIFSPTLTRAVQNWIEDFPHLERMATGGESGSGTVYAHPSFVEALMGFPKGWTCAPD
jgi:hypothetical protein